MLDIIVGEVDCVLWLWKTQSTFYKLNYPVSTRNKEGILFYWGLLTPATPKFSMAGILWPDGTFSEGRVCSIQLIDQKCSICPLGKRTSQIQLSVIQWVEVARRVGQKLGCQSHDGECSGLRSIKVRRREQSAYSLITEAVDPREAEMERTVEVGDRQSVC